MVPRSTSLTRASFFKSLMFTDVAGDSLRTSWDEHLLTCAVPAVGSARRGAGWRLSVPATHPWHDSSLLVWLWTPTTQSRDSSSCRSRTSLEMASRTPPLDSTAMRVILH